ncbi:MAG: GNAT family N-acetyltransferase [Dehalococcoidia bacterium]
MIGDKILEGEKVRLRPVAEEDLPRFQRWLNDPDVNHWLEGVIQPPPTLGEELAWFERAKASQISIVWSIETKQGQLLGNVAIFPITTQQRASFGIFIGDKAMWDRGYGTDTVRTLLHYAFHDLGLHRVQLECHEDNRRAIRCYEKCGFRHEGLLREHYIVDGQFTNTVVMGILREEFQG